jgi:hypothetical protein
MNTYRFSPNSTSTLTTPQGPSKTSMVAIAHTFYYFPTPVPNSKSTMLLLPTITSPIFATQLTVLRFSTTSSNGTNGRPPLCKLSIGMPTAWLFVDTFINVFT